MRVLFLENNPVWLYGLPMGFHDAGYEIRASGPLTGENIYLKVDEFQPDLAISMGWGNEQIKGKQTLIRNCLKAVGIPHVYWATEDPHFTQSFTLPLLMRMQPDFVFTICAEMVEFYKKVGIPAAHLDFGYHPLVHRRVSPLAQYRSKLAVVANAYPDTLAKSPGHYRLESSNILIKPLIQAELDLHFWGRDWDKMSEFLGDHIPQAQLRDYIPYPEAHRVYSSVDINIGLQNYPFQVSQRTYEILGSGGFLLTTDTPAVSTLFKPGHDLVVSASPAETLDKVKYYLDHPDERELIRQQGQRSVGKHSYRVRAEYIMKTLREVGIIHG